MLYRVDTVGDGGAMIDTADTADMGVACQSADSQRETAISYARTMLAQCERKGYRGFYVQVIGESGVIERFQGPSLER